MKNCSEEIITFRFFFCVVIIKIKKNPKNYPELSAVILHKKYFILKLIILFFGLLFLRTKLLSSGNSLMLFSFVFTISKKKKTFFCVFVSVIGRKTLFFTM